MSRFVDRRSIPISSTSMLVANTTVSEEVFAFDTAAGVVSVWLFVFTLTRSIHR